ncbi:MAG TPA: exodeoxyribonuclease VII large subunit, partial [Bacteroidales bacterium]|nr:exodeoxyribonuclease VII large subunit [Bacteroidales bacterium]
FRLIREKENTISRIAVLKKNIPLILSRQTGLIDHSQQKMSILDPVNVLRRGYSITRLKGKSIKTTDIVEPGQLIETQVADGVFFSKVTKKGEDHE